jgi:hypothetical protein
MQTSAYSKKSLTKNATRRFQIDELDTEWYDVETFRNNVSYVANAQEEERYMIRRGQLQKSAAALTIQAFWKGCNLQN